ncbi:unnamed protein product [Lepeophtheirus salmonis]|uniref:(salmon louse) hypothetical protein n=1 Tax=Lepeophtheirus salmonis TaxID=72036 RepID=A0A7R8CVN4_LEPSM|nr:unnamed protein product [Lepeophtheirus salmonis]CAF2946415.1 unnamed protein product [Lepeophtheirus salmonis]
MCLPLGVRESVFDWGGGNSLMGQEACTILGQFEQVSVEIITDNTVTASKILTITLDLEFKKLVFNETKALDEAIQRITTVAGRFSQPTPIPGGQEGPEDEQERPQESVVQSFFEERVTGDSTRRNSSADSIMDVISYLLIQIRRWTRKEPIQSLNVSREESEWAEALLITLEQETRLVNEIKIVKDNCSESAKREIVPGSPLRNLPVFYDKVSEVT